MNHGAMSNLDPVTIGIVSISDRASTGVYEDKGLPALQDWLTRALKNPISFAPRLIPDEAALISSTLVELVDAGCSLILTTGGTGPALRDVTPSLRASGRFVSRCRSIAISRKGARINAARGGHVSGPAGKMPPASKSAISVVVMSITALKAPDAAILSMAVPPVPTA